MEGKWRVSYTFLFHITISQLIIGFELCQHTQSLRNFTKKKKLNCEQMNNQHIVEILCRRQKKNTQELKSEIQFDCSKLFLETNCLLRHTHIRDNVYWSNIIFLCIPKKYKQCKFSWMSEFWPRIVYVYIQCVTCTLRCVQMVYKCI